MNWISGLSQAKSDASDSVCNEPTHKLLTDKEKYVLLTFINERKSENNISDTEIDYETNYLTLNRSNQPVGGSYTILDRSYPKRQNIKEVNHMPPKACYRSTPYSKIKEGDMPAIVMVYKDHRNYDTTGHGDFKSKANLYFKSKGELREYINDEVSQSDFCAALNADLDFLLSKNEFIIRYYKGCKEMIEYCSTQIKGAPCNPDCPKYKKH
jgi:hypothetical protein